MARSVRLELILDTLKGVKGARELDKATAGVAKSLGDTAREGGKAGRAVDDAGDQMSDAARAAAKLDHEIDQLTGSLRELAIAQALSGESMTKQIREQEAQVRRLSRNRKLFGDLGDDAAPAFATSFAGRLGPLLAKMPISGPVLAAVGGVGAAAAPLLGGIISAAVIGGAGIGGVVGGLIVASKDRSVESAMATVAGRLQNRLNKAGGAFVEPALEGIRIIDKAIDTIDLEQIFSDSAKFVRPLAEGVSAALISIGDGLEKLVRNAGPVINEIGAGIRLIGQTVGEGLGKLSENSDSAAAALRTLFGVISSSIQTTFTLVDALSDLYELSQKLGGDSALQLFLRLTGNEARRVSSGTFGAANGIKSVQQAAEEATTALRPLYEAQEKLAARLQTVDAAARGELSAMKALSNELRSQTDPAFALINAQNTLKTAQDKAAEATRKHGRNSKEAREATRNLATAALDLQGAAGELAGKFDGKLTPSMRATFRAAGLTEAQIKDVETQLKNARTAADKYAGKYNANVTITGADAVAGKLGALSSMQRALKGGTTIPIQARRAFAYADGGPVRGPGTGTSDSIDARLSNNEHVWTAREVAAAGGHDQVENLRQAALRGQLPPGFARGGPVIWPYPTTAAMTRVPSRSEAMSVVGPPGGRTSDWIVAAARALVPGIRVISKDRPGARTLSGNRSYHALGRAVDFAPSKRLAELWNTHYKARTKELISPWNSLNIHNGSRHAYTGAIYRQHSGGNAHDHIAMRGGGVIREPVFGVGRSGRTYSFAENGRPERVLSAGQTAAGGRVNVGGVVIHVNGANHSVKEIAREVSREIGRTVDIYSRGVGV